MRSSQYDEVENLIVKCDSCKPLRAAGISPVCVAACAMRALDFGEIEDLRGKYGDGLVSELPCMPGVDETSPNLLMRAKDVASTADSRIVRL